VKKRKKCFFIFTRVACGGWGGAGKPVPVGSKFGFEFSIPNGFGGGAGYYEGGAGMLKPVPALPRCHV